MKPRNQKLQLALSAWQQVTAGEIGYEQALMRVIWSMLEPIECKVLGYAVQAGKVTAPELVTRFEISLTHASTVLKLLYDHGLLTRTLQIDDDGRTFVYAPVKGVENV